MDQKAGWGGGGKVEMVRGVKGEKWGTSRDGEDLSQMLTLKMIEMVSQF